MPILKILFHIIIIFAQYILSKYKTMTYKVDLIGNKLSKDASIMGKVYDFKKQMQLHDLNNLNVYKKHPQLSSCDREVLIYNRYTQKKMKCIMFGSNSYLGATIFPEAIKSATAATQEMGIGSGGVPLLTGTSILQNQLEKTIANFTGFDDTILFSSGYTANLGVITGLIRSNNLVIHDKLNHASLLDGTLLSGAKMLRYRHNDMKDLERLIQENINQYPNGILVVTDGVFSMDGDIANIPEILKICNKYNILLLIDDAHATGVIGKKGAGTLSHYGITDRKNIIVTGTLSKAIGTVGGYITASQEIIDYLRIYARSNMFSTALPPSICAAAIEVFNIIQETDIVDNLRYKAEYLRKKLRNEGFNILNTNTPIIPVIVGNQTTLTQMAKDAFEEGFIINPIFPPAVPANLTRFRISVMASHTKTDMDRLTDLLIKLFKKYDIDR